MDALKNILLAIAVTIFGAAVIGVTFIYDVLSSGYVIHMLWTWFVVSTFHVATLPVLAAAGISILIAYLTHRLKDPKDACAFKAKPTTKQSIGHLALTVLRPWLVLAVAAIIHAFM